MTKIGRLQAVKHRSALTNNDRQRSETSRSVRVCWCEPQLRANPWQNYDS
jgi:hypothetical protein